MNYFDEDDGTEFRDTPDEVNEQDAPPVNVRLSNPQPKAAPVAVQEEVYEEESQPETEEVDSEEEDYSAVLSDARLRLEQGKLYEEILKHDLFEGFDADERAIKNVQREIRKFAQERMEVMLGMRQTVSVAPNAPEAMAVDAFPFNALEVEVLKALAATATQGASRESDAFVPEVPQVRKSLNPLRRGEAPKKQAAKPIQKKAPSKTLVQKPADPVRRKAVDERIQQILREEGVTLEEVNAAFPPDYKPLDPSFTEKLSEEEIKRRNLQGAQRTQRRAASTTALPMPSDDQINAMYESRAATAAANPQMQGIMSLLLQPKRK